MENDEKMMQIQPNPIRERIILLSCLNQIDISVINKYLAVEPQSFFEFFKPLTVKISTNLGKDK